MERIKSLVHNRKVMIPLVAVLSLFVVSAAVLTYYASITQQVNVQQAVTMSGNPTVTLSPTYSPDTIFSGKYVLTNHDPNNSRSVLLNTSYSPDGNGVATNYYFDSVSQIKSAADRLVTLQNANGSWDWIVTNASAPTNTTYLNIAGVTAQGLLTAYNLTNDKVYLTSAEKTGDYLISQYGNPLNLSKHLNAFNVLFLYNLGGASNNNAYTNEANLMMNQVMTQNASDLMSFVKTYRGATSTPDGIVFWDLMNYVEDAKLAGNSAWSDDLVNAINSQVNGSTPYFNVSDSSQADYVIGLSAIVTATGNSDAQNALVNFKSNGYWTDANGQVQDTAYAVSALMSIGDVKDAMSGKLWLASNQSGSGWIESDGNEYSEVDSETLQAMPSIMANSATLPSNSNAGLYIADTFNTSGNQTYQITTYVNPA